MLFHPATRVVVPYNICGCSGQSYCNDFAIRRVRTHDVVPLKDNVCLRDIFSAWSRHGSSSKMCGFLSEDEAEFVVTVEAVGLEALLVGQRTIPVAELEVIGLSLRAEYNDLLAYRRTDTGCE